MENSRENVRGKISFLVMTLAIACNQKVLSRMFFLGVLVHFFQKSLKTAASLLCRCTS